MKICLASILIFIVTGLALAQQPIDCPAGFVCITPQAARKALVDSDLVTAQAAEIMTLRESVVKQKEVTVDIKIELAKAIGELTGAKGEVISLRAQLEFVLLHGRNKCGGLTLICIQK